MDFAHLTAEPLHEQAYAALRNALLMGRFAEGQLVTVRGLGASLGISATPVREALQRLIAEGAMELTANRSVQVPVMTRARFVEILGIRLRLEPLCAETAVGGVDASLLSRLTALNGEMDVALADGRFSDYLAANQSFHFQIYETSGQPFLQQLIGLCWLRTGPWLNRLANEGRFHAVATECHGKMIAALHEGNAPALAEAIRQDISDAAEVLLDILDS
ncbi:GntR family transcriptional regulator [Paracoccus pantotrophus]|uniref:Putative transcriptional regulator n=1 Tax=Paracoccus pantotrophus TaxID=82367 RepID=Q3S8F9_PARPN|nr:GntR family transcriptional regulator [Paracoccus pantotrophus]AAZ93586.1 putative transcriptional regulator [Paracoccus pantotrophus]RDD96922.1 GntR family transcriptional regulator [Paracoccus pantotrophus]WGR66605.1 GntR family transcriptional regulator [Paracoccus pantotrophus]